MLVTFQPSPTRKSVVYSKALPRYLWQAQDQYICDEWNHKAMQPIFFCHQRIGFLIQRTSLLQEGQPPIEYTAKRNIKSRSLHSCGIRAFQLSKLSRLQGTPLWQIKLPDIFRQEGVGVWAQNIYGQWEECVAAEVSVASLTLLLNWLGNFQSLLGSIKNVNITKQHQTCCSKCQKMCWVRLVISGSVALDFKMFMSICCVEMWWVAVDHHW